MYANITLLRQQQFGNAPTQMIDAMEDAPPELLLTLTRLIDIKTSAALPHVDCCLQRLSLNAHTSIGPEHATGIQ